MRQDVHAGRDAHAGVRADVKRLHSVREALCLLDFDDPSIADMRHGLLRAALPGPFLRAAEGRRFLGFLFTLHPQMVRLPSRPRPNARGVSLALVHCRSCQQYESKMQCRSFFLAMTA